MGLLHRLKRKRSRRGKIALPSPVLGRAPLPTPSAFRATAVVACAVILGAAVVWTATGTDSAQAVTTSTTGGSTTTTEFILKGEAKNQVDELTAKANAVQAELDTLNYELELKAEEYNKCVDDLETANARMSELRRTVADAQADKARQQSLLAQRLKAIYMSGGRDQLLQLLLLADGLDDLYNRVRLVSTLADQDRHVVTNLNESTTRLDLLMKAMEEQKREELRLKDQLVVKAKEIETKIAQREQTLAAVDQRVKTIIEQERQRQAAEQLRLQAELEAKIQAALLAAQARVLNGGQIYQGRLPQTDNAITNQLVQTAAFYMGVPYVWGGSKPSTGMDCSGFTRYVYKQHGVKLPHYSGYQAQMGVPVDLESIQPGDLLAFGFPVHHVGIYIGDGLYIHTPSEVKISRLSARNDLSAVRRFAIQMRTGDPLFN